MPEDDRTRVDVAVVGGGPAGLSAALWLARYRRRVRVYDDGEPRNAATWAVHGYPGLPEVAPRELLRRLREQAAAAGAEIVRARIAAARGEKGAFAARTSAGRTGRARRLLLAYGRRDVLPEIPGVADSYGRSLFHCPDCDGPSMADGRVGVIGWDRTAARTALYLRAWTDSVTLLANGRARELGDHVRRALAAGGVPVRGEHVLRLVPRPGRRSRVELDDGTALTFDGVFCHLGTVPSCRLAGRLGCALDRHDCVWVDESRQTTVPGVYAAGDMVGHPQLVIQAAADGVRAALAIHRSLLPGHLQL